MSDKPKFKRNQYIVYGGMTMYKITGVRKSREVVDNYYYLVEQIAPLKKSSSDLYGSPYVWVVDSMSRLATSAEVLLYGKTTSK